MLDIRQFGEKVSPEIAVWPPVDVMPILFILFLSFFVLLGIYPAVQRTVWKVIDFFKARERLARSPHSTGTARSEEFSLAFEELPQLDVYENLILKRLASAGRKGLISEVIVQETGIERPLVKKTLTSLEQKSLVRSLDTFVAGNRYALSAKGRSYAVRQGFLPFPQRSYWSKWP